jgi:5-methylthioadenosine/S-adenosylhomocysteine deaminase
MTPQAIELLLTHALIVTQDAARRVLPDSALAVQNGRILALGPTAELCARFAAAEAIDLSGKIIFPGLVNTHTHLFQVATKGLGEDMAVQDWVEVVTGPTAIHITPEEMNLFCLSGCLEMIHGGVTTVVDMSYRAHTFALHEQNILAMQQSGLRGRYTSIISDFGVDYGVAPQLIMPIEWFIDQYGRLLDRYPPDDRLAVWVAIGAPWTISDEGMAGALEFSLRTSTPMVMHINENGVDNYLSQQRHAKNIVPYLDEIGFLRPDLLAIHCVVTNDEDIELYRRHDVKISYNPVSNMYLGSGIAPMVKMARAGLTIGLGVDGAGSNNSQDMIETLKMAALVQKAAAGDASVVDAQTVLDWATLGGARALRLEDNIGSLEPGKCADLFVVAPNSARIVPIHDPVASLVYSGGVENVVLTMANGKVLMREGVIQHFDEAEILCRCQEAALALAQRCGSNRKVRRSWKGSAA